MAIQPLLGAVRDSTGMTGGLYRIAVASGALAAAMGLSSGALAATASGPTEAVIVSPLSLVNTDDLDFGLIIRTAAAGTVTINADTGARAVTGGAIAAGGVPKRGEFVGVGRPGILSIVSIAPSVTLTNGAATMPATLSVEGGTGLRLFPGSGVQTFRVGGTLTVAANQAQGNYAGTYTLTVTYF